ncbi:MAG: bifunctional glutamate N-acetyltransferase/amino-acid acetyltransferase ArgJ [Alphaproteobacteria bacterium]|nr:bifunctional glutamate N-acetyltransferase/amino-acid acetyltransferase ArgJ [Alphaproteobacteria bacterium]
MFKKSPLAPAKFPEMPPVAGVRIAGMAAGLKESGRPDLFMAEFAPGTTIAGVFTRSACASAPVAWCRKILPGGRARGIVVNSGNANAFTGKAGDKTVAHTVRRAAELLGCRQKEVFVASTGVIGEPVAQDYLSRKLAKLHKRLSMDAWQDASAAIMTTDTFQKVASRTALIGDTRVTLTGMAKGSGMIAPDMATMLSFLFTDAKIPAAVLQKLLNRANSRSFNCITVDSDTSTSDTALLAATGQARHPAVSPQGGGRLLADFARALEELMTDLAVQVVRDGEGAQKLVTIDVTGAASQSSARRIGLSIANSPLVKTAIAGSDANWGRIVMAVGKAGEKADRDRLSIAFGGVPITRLGKRVAGYDEAVVEKHLQGRDVAIAVDVGVGRGAARVWTCDLTHGYIEINADYRT